MGRAEETICVAVVGGGRVGKTTLAYQYMLGKCPRQCEQSIENTFSKRVQVDSKFATLQIRDTKQDPSQCLHFNAIVAVFDTSSRESFENLRSFSHHFIEFHKNGGLIALVGTHADRSQRQVPESEGVEMAKAIGAEYFHICANISNEAKRPWDYLLRRIVHPRPCNPGDCICTPLPIQQPISPPSPAGGFTLTAAGETLYRWPASILACFGLRKSGVWY